MRKLSTPRGGGETVGVLALEVAALMSRAASLWRALGDANVAHLRAETVRLEGVRRLVADDDAALLALALAEMADACRDLSRAVARFSGRCADPLLRRFDALFAGHIEGGADPHGLRYAASKKMDRKARKMQRLVASTAHLCQELDVLAELEQGLRCLRRQGAAGGGGETTRRVTRQRQEVDSLRTASLWNRSFDYAVRLLARSLFTIVARIIEVFSLEPKNVITPVNDDVRRFLLSRSPSLRQLKWPVAGKQLIGCMITGSKSPVRERWIHGDGDLPLRFSCMSASNEDFSINYQFQEDHMSTKLSTSVFESSHDVLMNAPEATLGAAALALHYANLIIFIEKLATAPQHICPDERDDMYNMLTDRIRASLRACLKPLAKNMSSSSVCDPIMAAEWADTVQRILGWLAPLAHNMIRWQSEKNFEQRNAASSTSVLLVQTLQFADQKKTEAAITELLVGLNYLWRSGRELHAKAKLESAGSGNYDGCAYYIG